MCTYRVAEAPPYDTPQGHVRVHYVADSGRPDSPALAATRVAGVPDWVVSVGEAAEAAWARETALGFPAPPADDGDGAERGGDARYDLYVCDLASPALGELAATVPDPPGSGFSYVVVDDDYAPQRSRRSTTAGVEQLRVSVAHELFHAIQIGEGRGRSPGVAGRGDGRVDGGEVAPPDVDREIYRVALGGAGTEEPFWSEGDLHEYGAWWLVAAARARATGFVRRLLALAAVRGEDDPRGLELLARALRRPGALEAAFVRFARAAVDDPLVGRPCARGARRDCAPAAGSCCVRAAAAQLAALARADRREPCDRARTGARPARRGRSPRLPRARARDTGRCGSRAGRARCSVLVVGGAGGAQDVAAHAHRANVALAAWVTEHPFE